VAEVEDAAAARDAAGTDEPAPQYVGLITRTIAFVIDAAAINLVAVIVGAGVALALSLFQHVSGDLETVLQVIGGVAYALWVLGYFVAFWSATGQTPGARMMQCRVVAANRGRVAPLRGLIRCLGMILAALPLFAGYLLIPFDRQQRGFQDRFARTLVVDAPGLSVAERAAARRRGTGVDLETPAGVDADRSSDPGEDGQIGSRQPATSAWQATPASAPEHNGPPG
jgi:uncharacterized RDD family membrane protein YckC